MKTVRQVAILDIIEKQNVETQEELAEALRERGIKVTQATVSRDIKELRLLGRGVVVVDRKGIVRYIEYVSEIKNEPDYDAALKAVRELK